MTVRELKNLSHLQNEIESLLDHLQRLRESAGIKSPRLDGMPRQPGVSDRVGDLVPQIIDEEQEVVSRIRSLYDEKQKVQRWIFNIPDSRLRILISSRYLDGLSWRETAFRCGDQETEGSARNAVHRYLNAHCGR